MSDFEAARSLSITVVYRRLFPERRGPSASQHFLLRGSILDPAEPQAAALRRQRVCRQLRHHRSRDRDAVRPARAKARLHTPLPAANPRDDGAYRPTPSLMGSCGDDDGIPMERAPEHQSPKHVGKVNAVVS